MDTLRLNPLAFPRNPYHHLVKHYQDGQLKRGRLDPELDARLALDVFDDQQTALRDAPLGLLAAWHWLTGTLPDGAGFDAVFASIRYGPRPADAVAKAAVHERLAGTACQNRGRDILENVAQSGLRTRWLGCQCFRDAAMGSTSPRPVSWFANYGICATRRIAAGAVKGTARKELSWFGFDDFRPEPKDMDKPPMQQSIVEAAMAGEHVLGTLPTGTGKSLCYQIPALSRYYKTGALTVVISLGCAMAAGLGLMESARAWLSGCCPCPAGRCAGAWGMRYSSSRRSNSVLCAVHSTNVRSELGCWTRPIASRSGGFRLSLRGTLHLRKGGTGSDPPVLCLTATAKPDVVEDIKQHFRDELDVGLKVFDGGARRTNLEFKVVLTTGGEKFAHIHQILMADLPPDASGGRSSIVRRAGGPKR